MILLTINNQTYCLKNTLCKEGAFRLLQGNITSIKNTICRPFTGAAPSFFDTLATHPNWSETPGVSYAGQAFFSDPPASGIITSDSTTWSFSSNQTINGVYVENGSYLFSAALLTPALSVTPLDTVIARFILNGEGKIS